MYIYKITTFCVCQQVFDDIARSWQADYFEYMDLKTDFRMSPLNICIYLKINYQPFPQKKKNVFEDIAGSQHADHFESMDQETAESIFVDAQEYFGSIS